MQKARFDQAMAAFDAANEADPNQEEWNGKMWPKELLYARRMTERLTQFQPEASESLQLAARAQHICRWEIPRDQYPRDRKGYHAWRNALKALHAEKAGDILAGVGYEKELIEKVQQMLLKKNLKADADTQSLEDVICLVFLAHYLPDFSSHTDEAKMITILQKTWRKMSAKGHEAALQLPFSPQHLNLVQKALSPS
ncbi:MAG: DUF4202 domain-containing protein [Bacteroidota bacterium]